MDAVKDTPNQIIFTSHDADMRHTKKVVVSYVDGHVILTNAIKAVYAPKEDLPASEGTLSMPQTGGTNGTVFETADKRLSASIASGDNAWTNYVTYNDGAIKLYNSRHDGNGTATYYFGPENSGTPLTYDPITVTKGWEVSMNVILKTSQYGASYPSTLMYHKLITVYDASGKAIIDFLIKTNHEQQSDLFLNGTVRHFNYNNNWVNYDNDPKQKKIVDELGEFFKATNLLSLSATANGCTVKVGPYALASGTFKDPTCEWNKPAYVTMYQSCDGGDNAKEATFSRFRFAGI